MCLTYQYITAAPGKQVGSLSLGLFMKSAFNILLVLISVWRGYPWYLSGYTGSKPEPPRRSSCRCIQPKRSHLCEQGHQCYGKVINSLQLYNAPPNKTPILYCECLNVLQEQLTFLQKIATEEVKWRFVLQEKYPKSLIYLLPKSLLITEGMFPRILEEHWISDVFS